MPLTGLAIFSAAIATTAPAVADGTEPCTMSAVERGWVDGSIQAWRYMARERLKLPPEAPSKIVVFNERCQFEAMTTDRPKWAGRVHGGEVSLPDGSDMPVGVASATMHDDKQDLSFFVMALPSIWEARSISMPGDANGLRGVFLHEFAHVRQISALKPAFAAASAIQPMPDDLDDDGVQKRFGSDPAYAAVAEKEMRLLSDAANEPDESKARELARQALALIEARQSRWFTGTDAIWKHYDDIFLTMEGFGQWTAYAWLSDPRGGAMTRAAAEEKMRGRKRWWTQEEGLSLFLVIDRFVPDWPQRAFADKPALGIDLLRLAVATPAQR